MCTLHAEVSREGDVCVGGGVCTLHAEVSREGDACVSEWRCVYTTR